MVLRIVRTKITTQEPSLRTFATIFLLGRPLVIIQPDLESLTRIHLGNDGPSAWRDVRSASTSLHSATRLPRVLLRRYR
jgi:hypothetical protein